MVGMMENDPKYFGEGAGIAVRKGETELADRFSAAIDAIRENGDIRQGAGQVFRLRRLLIVG